MKKLFVLLAVLLFGTCVLAQENELIPLLSNFWGFEGKELSVLPVLGSNAHGGMLAPVSRSDLSSAVGLPYIVGKDGTAAYLNEAIVLRLRAAKGAGSDLYDLKKGVSLYIAAWITPATEKLMYLASKMPSGSEGRGWSMGVRDGKVFVSLKNDQSTFRIHTTHALPVAEWSHVQAYIAPLMSASEPKVAIFVNGTEALTAVSHSTLYTKETSDLSNNVEVAIGARGVSPSGGDCSGNGWIGGVDSLLLSVYELGVRVSDVILSPEDLEDMALRRVPAAVSTCEKAFCMNGACIGIGTESYCNCFPGFSGANCTEQMDVGIQLWPDRITEGLDWTAITSPCEATRIHMEEQIRQESWSSLETFRAISLLVNTTLGDPKAGGGEQADVEDCSYEVIHSEYEITSPNAFVVEDRGQGEDDPDANDTASVLAQECISHANHEMKQGNDIFWDNVQLSDSAVQDFAALQLSIANLLPEDSEERSRIINNPNYQHVQQRRRLQQLPTFNFDLDLINNNDFNIVGNNFTGISLSRIWSGLTGMSFQSFQNLIPDSLIGTFVGDANTFSPPLCSGPTCWRFAVPPPRVPSLLTEQEQECHEYLMAAKEYEVQRVYQDQPVSQFYVKKFCVTRQSYSILITDIPWYFQAVVHLYDLVTRTEVSRWTSLGEQGGIRGGGHYAVPRCFIAVVRPLNAFSIGSVQIESVVPPTNTMCSQHCASVREEGSWFLAWSPINLNVDGFETSIESHGDDNYIQVALTRRSYALRNRLEVPLLAFGADGELMAYDGRSGVGNQGQLRFHTDMKSLAVLGPVSDLYTSELLRKKSCTTSGKAADCEKMINRLDGSYLPRVNILVNDRNLDGDRDGLGASLEASLCLCDPLSRIFPVMCPPGYIPIGRTCEKAYPETPTYADKVTPHSRWSHYCQEKDERLRNGDMGSDVYEEWRDRIHDDTDGDGLLDGHEVLGARLPRSTRSEGSLRELVPETLMLNLMGVDPQHKDILVEIDLYMKENDFMDNFLTNPFADVGVPWQSGNTRKMFWRSLYFDFSYNVFVSGVPEHADNKNGRKGIRPHFDMGFDPVRNYESQVGKFTRRDENGKAQPDYDICRAFVVSAGVDNVEHEAQKCLQAVRAELRMDKEGVFGDWGGSTIETPASVESWCHRQSFPVDVFGEEVADVTRCTEQLMGQTIRNKAMKAAMRPYRTSFMRYVSMTYGGSGQAGLRHAESTIKNEPTMPHELGHTLGLGHGGPHVAGGSDMNGNPFYISIMNYLYSYDRRAKFLSIPEEQLEYLTLQPDAMFEYGSIRVDLEDDQVEMISDNVLYSVWKDEVPGTISFDFNGDSVLSYKGPDIAFGTLCSNGSMTLDGARSPCMVIPLTAALGTNDKDPQLTVEDTVGAPALTRVDENMYAFYILQGQRSSVQVDIIPLGARDNLDCLDEQYYAPRYGWNCQRVSTSTSVSFSEPLKSVNVVRYMGGIAIFGVNDNCDVRMKTATISGNQDGIEFSSSAQDLGFRSCQAIGVANYPDYASGAAQECVHAFFDDDSGLKMREAYACAGANPYAFQIRDMFDLRGDRLDAQGPITASPWPVPGDELHLHPVYAENDVKATGAVVFADSESRIRLYGYDHDSSSWKRLAFGNIRACPQSRIGIGFHALLKTDLTPIHPSEPGKFWMMFADPTTAACDSRRVRGSSMYSTQLSATEPLLNSLSFGLNLRSKANIGNAWVYTKGVDGGYAVYTDSRLATLKAIYVNHPESADRLKGVRYLIRANGVHRDTVETHNDMQVLASSLCRPLRCRVPSNDATLTGSNWSTCPA